ncbi:MAG: hypothetical protein HYV42_05140 [Candidatus Magasanikbacteria bacterium]|nr:hypothetical protein [Candidatus Magasanikbacteria bacterium]
MSQSIMSSHQPSFTEWFAAIGDEEKAAAVMQNIIGKLKVAETAVREAVARQLQTEFYKEYLAGYFEATVLDTSEAFFIDYNRLLGQMVASANFSLPSVSVGQDVIMRGATAFPGKVVGRVCLVDVEKNAKVDFHDGDILVCANTDVRYLPYMRRAGAIVTDRGSILSHAAIVARELKKPCIVNTREATSVLKTGEMVEVDAVRGIIKKPE